MNTYEINPDIYNFSSAAQIFFENIHKQYEELISKYTKDYHIIMYLLLSNGLSLEVSSFKYIDPDIFRIDAIDENNLPIIIISNYSNCQIIFKLKEPEINQIKEKVKFGFQQTNQDQKNKNL